MPSRLAEQIRHAQREHRPLVMGVVNVTPDSFSDGGRFERPDRAIAHALALVAQGADILDIGGESSRPGSAPVAEDEELERVIPVIEGLHAATGTPISIDSCKAGVMRAAVAAGARMINDVNALRAPGALAAAAELAVPVCLMHMQGEPRTMQDSPSYGNIIQDITLFFEQRIQACLEAGIAPASIVLDPGFGFGKTLAHNLDLLGGLAELTGLGYPVLAGLSRKSMLGELTGRDRPDQRVAASVAAALLAAQRGAAMVRVHDVAETADALKVWLALRDHEKQKGQ